MTGTEVHDELLDELRRVAHRSRGMSRFSPPARQRWINIAAAAAVIAVVAAATVVVYDSSTGRDATAAVHQAVETTIEVSDSATSSTTVTYDLDDLAEPWEMTIEAIFSDGNTGYVLTSGPAVPEMGIPELGSYAEVVIGDLVFRSIANEPWEGPTSVPREASGPGAAILSNLTFGVTIEDLGGLYEFVDLGREDFEGIAMSHYRTHTTPAGAGAGFLMSFGRFLMMTNQEPAQQLDRVQLDVWVDSDDLIRRVSYSVIFGGSQRCSPLRIGQRGLRPSRRRQPRSALRGGVH